MFVLDKAICVACGNLWLPWKDAQGIERGYRTRQAPVIWYDLDMGPDEVEVRIRAGFNGRRWDQRYFKYLSMPDPWIDLFNDKLMSELIADIKRVGAGLVVFDTLGDATTEEDENSSKMKRAMRNLRRIPVQSGAGVIIIHHPTKDRNNWVNGCPPIRGHSSIHGKLDRAFYIGEASESNEVIIKAAKSRGAMIQPFGARFSCEHIEGTEELSSFHFDGISAPRSKKADAEIRLKGTILEVIDASPGIIQRTLTGQIRDRMGHAPSHKNLTRMISELEGGGYISIDPGETQAKLHCICDGAIDRFREEHGDELA